MPTGVISRASGSHPMLAGVTGHRGAHPTQVV
jgi:hypothetical protein